MSKIRQPRNFFFMKAVNLIQNKIEIMRAACCLTISFFNALPLCCQINVIHNVPSQPSSVVRIVNRCSFSLPLTFSANAFQLYYIHVDFPRDTNPK